MELDAWTLTAAPIVGSADLTFHLTTTYNGFHSDSAAAVNALNYAESDGLGPREVMPIKLPLSIESKAMQPSSSAAGQRWFGATAQSDERRFR